MMIFVLPLNSTLTLRVQVVTLNFSFKFFHQHSFDLLEGFTYEAYKDLHFIMGTLLKAAVIEILNNKINELLMKKERAKREGDLIRMGSYQRIINILTEIVWEIQDKL